MTVRAVRSIATPMCATAMPPTNAASEPGRTVNGSVPPADTAAAEIADRVRPVGLTSIRAGRAVGGPGQLNGNGDRADCEGSVDAVDDAGVEVDGEPRHTRQGEVSAMTAWPLSVMARRRLTSRVPPGFARAPLAELTD